MRISVGRCSAAALLVLGITVGCGSKDHSTPASQTASLLCQAPDDCPRGAPCGCSDMDPGCDCESCQVEGNCHGTGPVCAPASDADCNEPGGACTVYGFCHLVVNEAGAHCLAVSDEDCRHSLLCAQWGSCVFDQQFQQCFAENVDDCAASAGCRELGCCSLVGTECVRNDGTCPYKCCGDDLC